MVEIKTPSRRRRYLKRFLAVAGILALLLFALHFWFIRNARFILQQYITEQSDGKIKLELSKLNINLWTSRLQIHKGDLMSTDSISEPITYRVTFSKLSLRVGSVWDLLLEKRLYLDSLKIYDPVIEVMQWRKDTSQVFDQNELSLPQEMGKVYNSLLNALDDFSVRRILIDNAKISLINKMKPGSIPVSVSNIFFDLSNKIVKKENTGSIPQTKRSFELRIADQNIALPGGRHSLAFKSFKLRLFKNSIEMDSCTVMAKATDSLKSSYKIFFKKLLFTGVNFAALSSKNLIKAEKVYCEYPFFDFSIYTSDAVKMKTTTPDPDKLLRELTGNLDLNYVDVKKAGIRVEIYGKTKQSFYNTQKDNFVIHGLRINPDLLHPVTIDRFNMTLRDYRLYNGDGSSVFSFDSLKFLNNKIILNNFAILSKSRGSKLRNDVDIKIPYFKLSQLDWYQLIFDQNVVAKEVFLQDPIINFTRRKTGTPGKKIDLFNTLINLDSLVALDNVTMRNGQVNMRLGANTSFNVQNIDFKVSSNKILRSTTKEGLRNAVDHLSFSNGVLRLKDITAQLQHARYTDKNLIYADKVSISGKDSKIAATVNQVYIDNLQLDDNADTIVVDGIKWESASVALKTLPVGSKNGNGNSSLHLRNIAGKNTQLDFSNGSTAFSTLVRSLKASSLIKKGNGFIRVEGVDLKGDNLDLSSKNINVAAGLYQLSESKSSLKDVHIKQIKDRDSLHIYLPSAGFSASLNDLFANTLYFSAIQLNSPVLNWSKWSSSPALVASDGMSSLIRIDQLTALAPDFTMATHRNDSVSLIHVPATDQSSIKAADVVLSDDGVSIGSLLINASAATYVKPTGEIVGVEKGNIDMDLNGIHFSKKEGRMQWNGFVNHLFMQNDKGISLGKTKNRLSFQKVALGNLNLSSDYLPNLSELLKANVTAWLRIPEGRYVDSTTTLLWYNANYTNSTRTLSLDSFAYHPTKSLHNVLAHAPYQFDYITLKTGAITMSGFDAERYKTDSSFVVHSMQVERPLIEVYRDRKAPSSPFKKDRPLPVELLKRMKFPVSIQSIKFDDGLISYTEKNGESGKEGNLFLTRVNGVLENIKNRDLLDDDSLLLTFNASLMDSAHVALHIKQSYTDSLSNFLYTGSIKPADLSIFNSVLVPLSNVKIRSGVLDSVSFRAIGRTDLAMGEMNMHYHHLRIRLVKDGDPDRSTLKQKVLSFLANAFVISSKNTNREGFMYYKHPRSQSFVNYIIKMTLSGVKNTVSRSKNRKAKKRYKKELKESEMPLVELY